MSRTHVHLAAGLPEKGGVISGMRGSCELVVHVDVRSAVLEGGLRFYRSSNGVILTPGLGEEGLLPLRFLKRVTDRRTGGVVYCCARPGGAGEAAGGSVAELEAQLRSLSADRALSKSARKNQRRNLAKRIAAASAAAVADGGEAAAAAS